MKFLKPTLITLTSPTAGGKNYLLEQLQSRFGLKRIVSSVTRPMRAGEVEGIDYYFITTAESEALEARGALAELNIFRGYRYGVSKDELHSKMLSGSAPIVILEPNGVQQFKHLCTEAGWETFTVYLHTPEDVRIDRLVQRTHQDIVASLTRLESRTMIAPAIKNLIRSHTDRILSLMGEERAWSNKMLWDAIVPGDDVEKAIDMIQRGVHWRNHKNTPPAPYDHAV